MISFISILSESTAADIGEKINDPLQTCNAQLEQDTVGMAGNLENIRFLLQLL